MKKAFIPIIAALFLIGCSNTVNSKVEENETIELSFSFIREVDSITQVPLSRNVTDNVVKNWYAIQVYDENGYYAYGFFDNLDDMKLLCIKNSTYNFTVDMIPEGEAKVYKFSCANSGWTNISNSFFYSKTESIRYLGQGFLYMNYPSWDTFNRPSCDRFYGSLSNYTATENGGININLSRASFKVKFAAKDFSSGSLELSLDNAPTFYLSAEDGTEFEEFYSFNYLSSESENIGVSIIWVTTEGKRIPLVAQNIDFRRNTLTTLEFTVKINESATTFSITADEELVDGDIISLDTIDELVDTEIDPTI